MPPKGKRNKAACPKCGRVIAHTQYGAFYNHNDTEKNRCPASGRTVESGGKWLPQYRSRRRQ